MDKYRQLMDAAKQADAAGNVEDAQRLIRLAAAHKPTAANTGPKANNLTALDKAANFSRGLQQGFKNVTQKGEEWLYKGMGKFDAELGEDMLGMLNTKRARQAEQNSVYRMQTPNAFGAGEMAGEIATTLPIGGVGGVGAKGVVRGAGALLGKTVNPNTLRMAGVGLVGEGAAIGAYNSDGDSLSEVAADAGTGAAVDVAIGGTIGGVTKFGGAMFRRLANGRRAAREVDTKLQPVADNIKKASEYGGYTLDAGNAAATRQSLRAVQDLGKDESLAPVLDEFRVKQVDDITNRAGELVDGFGDRVKGNTKDVVRNTLASFREADARNYKTLYKEFDALAAETRTYLSPNKVAEDVIAIRNSPEVGSAVASLRSLIDDDFASQGIYLSEAARKKALGDANKLPFGLTKDAAIVGEGINNLTIENAENLIQKINAHWKMGMSNGEKRYLGKIKEALEKSIDSHLDTVIGQGSEQSRNVIDAARAARKARSEFSDAWTKNDIVNKLSERTEVGEFVVDYTRSISKLSKQDLTKVKARLLGREGGDKALRSMQQAPLLDALQAATADTTQEVLSDVGGKVDFNVNKFRQVINQIPEETQVELWGKEGADNIKKTMEAWQLRTRKTKIPGNINTSNTALELMRQLRFLPTGRTRNLGMAASGMVGNIQNAMTQGVRDKALKDILEGGTVPDSVRDEMISNALDGFESQFTGAGGQEFGNLLRQLTRTGVVLNFTE